MPSDKRLYAAIGAIAGFLVFIGSFLPWVKVTAPFIGQLTKSGIEDGGDGLYTLLAALAAFVVVAFYFYGRARERATFVALLVLGAVITVIAIIDIDDVDSRAENLEREVQGLATVSIGEGLYLTLVGGIGLAATGAVGVFYRPREHDDSSDKPTHLY